MSEIYNAIKLNKPDLNDKTITMYDSMLRSMCRKIGLPETIKSVTNNKEAIINYLNGLEKPSSRKVILFGLLHFGEDTDYREMAGNCLNEINKSYKAHKVDETKKETMMTMNELRELYKSLKENVEKKPTEDNCVKLLLSILFTGVVDGLPPRRLMDYVEMKKINFNTETDNYLTDDEFVFNNYKTSGAYGKQTIKIPDEIKPLLNKVMEYGDCDYLFNYKGEKYTIGGMSMKLKRLFGVSVDGLRSIYISNIYKDLPDMSVLEITATNMAHHIGTAVSMYLKDNLKR